MEISVFTLKRGIKQTLHNTQVGGKICDCLYEEKRKCPNLHAWLPP